MQELGLSRDTSVQVRPGEPLQPLAAGSVSPVKVRSRYVQSICLQEAGPGAAAPSWQL